jgi:hypothetical protein
MRLDYIPRPDADLKNRRDWLVYQFMRYGRFHHRLTPLHLLVNAAVYVVAFHFMGWWGIPVWVMFMFISEEVYERVVFEMMADYHTEMATFIYDGSKETAVADNHKLAVILNDLENFLSNTDKKKNERLLERLRDTYGDFKKGKEATNGNATEGQEPKAD